MKKVFGDKIDEIEFEEQCEDITNYYIEDLNNRIRQLEKENEELKKRIDWFKEEHNHIKSYCESPSVEDVLHSMP